MSENAPPASATAGTNGDVPGQPFYDKARQHLKDLLQKKRMLERSLALQEDSIYKKETDYLEDTPSGNIITGFEAYTKGSGSSAPGQRRRAAVQESNRVFSRSSISYNVNAVGVSLLHLPKNGFMAKYEVAEGLIRCKIRNLQWKQRSQHRWRRCQIPR
jgi:Histone acetyltransferase subunit NuA4